MNQVMLKKAVNTFKTVASNYVETELFKEENVLNNMEIPIITNDSEVQEFIIRYELYKPEKMIDFFVDVGFSAVESISSSINDLKLLDLINSVSKIQSAEQLCRLAIDNPKEKKDYFKSA